MIPDELKSLKQWGLYHRVWNEERGKYNKIPLSAWTGRAAKSNDPETWSGYDTATASLEKYPQADGLAFFFGNGYVGLDIDHIADEIKKYQSGDTENEVSLIDRITNHTYMEYSMSHEGIHAIFKGTLTGTRRKKGNHEMYQSGRFFALTGDALGERDSVSTLSAEAVHELESHCFGTQDTQQMELAPVSVPTTNTNAPDLSIGEIIDKIIGSAQGERFAELMDGDWQSNYPSQSEADLALANILAFWCAKDYEKMDTIFRESGLYRPKWDEKHGTTTYGDALLNKAINEVHEVYTGKDNIEGMYTISDKINEKKTYPNRSWDDVGNGLRLVDHFGDIIRYSYEDKTWYIYNGRYWEEDKSGEITTIAVEVADYLKKEQPVISDSEAKDKAMKAWQKWIKSSHSSSGINNMISMSQRLVPVRHGDFDKEPMYLNAQNGYVDLATGELHPHDSKMMFSKIAGCAYNPNARSKAWEDCLSLIFCHDAELIHYVQKLAGYAITGSTAEQIMAFFYGDGRNGKSVFLNALQTAAGSYARTMDAQTIMAKRGMTNNAATSDVARLEGARLVAASESNEGERLDESRIKQITGGDTIVARKLYGSEFEFKSVAKIFMATNHKPIVRGTDTGIWRRIRLIPFAHTITDDEVDKELADKLTNDAEAILNWLVQGAIMWQREGLKEPKAVSVVTDGYRESMDLVDRFISDCCEVSESSSCSASVLYRKFKEWANENGEYQYSSTKFGLEISKKFEKKRRRSGNVYIGIEPLQNSEYLFNFQPQK